MIGRLEPVLPYPRSFYVGTLSDWDPITNTSSNIYAIDSSQRVFIGRDPKYCQYVIDNSFVSGRHVHIYTIIFDRDDPQQVPPLVYAQDLSTNGTLWNGYPMGKDSGSFLLSNGDTLHLAPGVSIRYLYHNNMETNHLDHRQKVESRAFEHKYTITQRILGSGAYGKVHMAFKKGTGQQFACKIIDLRVMKEKFVQEAEEKRQSKFFKEFPVTKSEVTAVLRPRNLEEKLAVYDREAEILSGLSHPNIIGIEKVIKSSNTIYLFQDLITAGDLFSYIQYKGGRLNEIEAAVIMRQVCKALDYLHDRNIVHRDLKPDNILMTSLADGCRVVLTDFGCARQVGSKIGRMSTVVGTFDYSAPEVFQEIKRGYTKAVDLWSLGCVTFVLLTGDIPFRDPFTRTSSTEVMQTTGLAQLEDDFQRNKTQERAADFVRQLLVFDETERMDIKQALSHDWFTNRAHKMEFDALYKRAIKRWRPRVLNENLITQLHDLTHESPNTYEVQDYPSPLPDDSMGQQGLVRTHTLGSTTLSDPVLPPLYSEERPMSSEGFFQEGNTNQPPTSSGVAEIESCERPILSNEATQDSSAGGIDDCSDTKSRRTSSDHQIGWDIKGDGFMAIVAQLDSRPGHQDDDELYE